MCDIYSQASSVIVWLGEASGEAELAFDILAVPKRLEITKGLQQPDLRRHRSNRQWKSLKRLFNRPYWSRVWIIQEFVRAKSIIVWYFQLLANKSTFQNICQWLNKVEKYHSRHKHFQDFCRAKDGY
jgi:Heterokaryon incompatibility protein (HET)